MNTDIHPDARLTYCLNVHPGESLAEVKDALRDKAHRVREMVAPDRPFGVGLRLARGAATELRRPGEADGFRSFLEDLGLYAFTINGFPYGRFHGGRVKESVYAPDWRTAERRDYTRDLAAILAELLPEGEEGSISTVPVSFGAWMQEAEDTAQAVRMLADTALFLHRLGERTGRRIHLGLEPEPSCFLETTDDFLAFHARHLLREGAAQLRREGVAGAEDLIRRHIGVCFDTCHAAIQFEDVAAALGRYATAGVLVSKVQISAALECDISSSDGARRSAEALQRFCEPVYLHQARARTAGGKLRSWLDLPEAVRDVSALVDADRLRAHFHVPLFWEGDRVVRSTAACLTEEFFALLREGVSRHLEIETYTFDVLPPGLRSADVVDSIVGEFRWLLPRLRA